jgi:hypothetical protein
MKTFTLALTLGLLSSAAFAAGGRAPVGSWSCTAKGVIQTRFGGGYQSRTFWSGYRATREDAQKKALNECRMETYVLVGSCQITRCDQVEE